MVRFLSLVATVIVALPASAQHFYAAPGLAGRTSALGYRAPVLSPFDGRQFSGYAYAGYARAMAYPFVPSYGSAYSGGYQPYLTGYDAQTMVGASLTPSAPMNYLHSDADDTISAGRLPMGYRAPNLPTDIAQMTIHAPADAEVFVNGQKVTTAGAVRTYTTPTLAGPTAFEVKVKRGDAEQVLMMLVKPGDQPGVHVMP